MGCGASVHVVNNVVNKIETPIVNENCGYLAGKFSRTTIPKEVWLCRMREFIKNHVMQLKHYCAYDIDIMYQKLQSYDKNCQMTNNNDKHSQAVKVLVEMFNTSPRPSPKQMREELTTMALDYCIDDKEHEFEEIAFVFSIIINSPMIKFYETKY